MTQLEFDRDSDKALSIIRECPMHPIEKVIREITPRSHSLADFACDMHMSLEEMALIVTGQKRLNAMQIKCLFLTYRPGIKKLFRLYKTNQTIAS